MPFIFVASVPTWTDYGLRIDIMARLRGVDAFEALWARRTTVSLEDGLDLDLLGLPDLVAAKKTQRDKDWLMLARLVESNYLQFGSEPTPERVRFWLQEMRTVETLTRVIDEYPEAARQMNPPRDAVAFILNGARDEAAEAIRSEELGERRKDLEYWRPLRKQLEALRHASRP